MSGAAAGAASTAYLAQVASAIKACGTLVRVEPQEFLKILARQDQPLVVHSSGGVFTHANKYLTGYKGLAFHCKTREELRLPANAELIVAKKFSIPDL